MSRRPTSACEASGPGRADPDLERILARLIAASATPEGGWLVPWARELQGAAAVEVGTERWLRRAGRVVGRIERFGSLVLGLPGSDPGSPEALRRVLEVDRTGAVRHVLHRRADGRPLAAAVVTAGGGWVGWLPGGGVHPLWGASDRVVRLPDRAIPGNGPPSPGVILGGHPLTMSGVLEWEAIHVIPPLAAPEALPAGAGSALLGLVASLARDQGVAAVRYRGPFPTEQLFWSLTESFHLVDPDAGAALRFTREAEHGFATGEAVEPAIDWRPAPPERLMVEPGLAIDLRDGVEKVVWEGRTYHRGDWCPGRPDLRRPGHRVVRAESARSGAVRFVAGLAVLGEPVADHLVLSADGGVVDRPATRAPDAPGGPPDGLQLGTLWRDALGPLIVLDATPLLATALLKVWPNLALGWGSVHRDLVSVAGSVIRLDPVLAAAFRRKLRSQPAAGRLLARRLVREIVDLVGPAVRRAATAWLEAEPPSRQAEHLDRALALHREELALGAAPPLGRLLDALVALEGLPPEPGTEG